LLSRRTVCAAAVIGLAAVGVVGAPATAARAAGCTAPSVAVVVDFTHFGGGIQRGCVTPGGTGLQVLAAVFTVTQVQRQPGFVCRISGLPTKSQDACLNTPPSNAYWAYFHGRAGSGWVYSAAGAANYVPPPGTVEGWAFGGGGPPGVSVASVLPTKPAPPPSHSGPRPNPTLEPTHGASAPPGTTAAATSAPTYSTTSTARTKPASTSQSAPPTSDTPSGSGPPTVQDVTQRAPKAASSGSGSAAPLVVTVAVAAALFAGGWYLSRRRRLSQ
jgi:hypothetical protein